MADSWTSLYSARLTRILILLIETKIIKYHFVWVYQCVSSFFYSWTLYKPHYIILGLHIEKLIQNHINPIWYRAVFSRTLLKVKYVAWFKYLGAMWIHQGMVIVMHAVGIY